MRTTWQTALLVLLLTVSAAADEATTSVMPADLTGVWNLDTTASDDLAGKLEALREQMVARAGGKQPSTGFGDDEGMAPSMGSRGAGGRGGMGSRGGTERGGNQGRGEAPDVSGPRDLALAMEQLLITVNDADVEIMDGTDWTRIWTPGGKPVQRDGPGGVVIEQAWWEKDTLVLSTNGGKLAITRRLHLEEEGKILVADVTVKVSGTSERVDARLEYSGY